MFHHKKKLCYVAYPKSASTTLRKHLVGLGFTKPIGMNGHATVKQILASNLHIKDYTFFTVYRDPVEHFISAYKHVKNKWQGKLMGTNIHINTLNEYLNYMEKKWTTHSYNFKNFLCDESGKLKINKFLCMDTLNRDFMLFCSEYRFPNIKLQQLNKIKDNIIVSLEQKKRIRKMYENNTFLYESVYNKSDYIKYKTQIKQTQHHPNHQMRIHQAYNNKIQQAKMQIPKEKIQDEKIQQNEIQIPKRKHPVLVTFKTN